MFVVALQVLHAQQPRLQPHISVYLQKGMGSLIPCCEGCKLDCNMASNLCSAMPGVFLSLCSLARKVSSKGGVPFACMCIVMKAIYSSAQEGYRNMLL